MRDLVASEIRRLHKKVAAADRRIALTLLPGKVRQKDPQKRRLRLQIGETSDGRPILGPWVRWQEATAGQARWHAEPDMGEQMMMWSQSGTVGDASMAVPGTYDKDHGAPSTSSDTAVFTCGSGRIEVGPEGIRLIGNKIVTVGETHLGDEGGKLLHRKGDADDDGDLAVGSATRVYAV